MKRVANGLNLCTHDVKATLVTDDGRLASGADIMKGWNFKVVKLKKIMNLKNKMDSALCSLDNGHVQCTRWYKTSAPKKIT